MYHCKTMFPLQQPEINTNDMHNMINIDIFGVHGSHGSQGRSVPEHERFPASHLNNYPLGQYGSSCSNSIKFSYSLLTTVPR